MVLGHVFTEMLYVNNIYMVNIGVYAITHVFLKKFSVPGLQCKLNENEQFLPS